jgi:hypothetical protein
MVEWLAGNRIRGTSAEKPVLGLQSPSVGGWKELGRFTSSSASVSITTPTLANKRYLMILGDARYVSSESALTPRFLFNGDTGSNYAERRSLDGGSDTTAVLQPEIVLGSNNITSPAFTVGYVSNLASKEKLVTGNINLQNTAGAGTAPQRSEYAGKWANTSNAISTVTFKNYGTRQFDSGSEVVVLGWDPTDTHATNFWEELASVDLSGGASTNLSSGTILAKKYLWVQMLMEQTVDSNYQLRFNADSGSNYAYRYKTDGGTEFTHASQTGMNLRSSTANLPVFVNMFIVNNSANEKLIIEHDIKSNTAGAGNAPLRTEQVGKWANTSAQITSVQLHSGSGNLNTNTLMKVWGHD